MMFRNILKSGLRTGTSALAIGLAVLATTSVVAISIGPDAAFADSHSGSQGGQGKKGGGGGSSSDHSHDDSEADDHDHTSDDDEGHDHESGSGGKGKGGSQDQGGKGQGGPDQAGGGSTGNRPVWAGEGIPEVELGRLNVVRSPSHVLDRAFDEAISNLTDEVAAFYKLDLAAATYLLRNDFDSVLMIDSPLQNLALLRDALNNGQSVVNQHPSGVNNDVSVLMAMFLGAASDKTIPIVPDTALAVSIMLGLALSPAEAAALAADAEEIRLAIQVGHD